MVCDKVVCESRRGGGPGGGEAEGQAEEAGYRIKNKNPTQTKMRGKKENNSAEQPSPF